MFQFILIYGKGKIFPIFPILHPSKKMNSATLEEFN